MLLAAANLGTGARVLVLDGCAGLLLGAAAERLGGCGCVRLPPTPYGDEKATNRHVRFFLAARQKRVLERWTNPKPLYSIWDRATI